MLATAHSELAAQVSFATSLSLLGINLMPLATAGLGSGVVLGFASQSVLANVVAGCNLVCLSLSSHSHICPYCNSQQMDSRSLMLSSSFVQLAQCFSI